MFKTKYGTLYRLSGEIDWSRMYLYGFLKRTDKV